MTSFTVLTSNLWIKHKDLRCARCHRSPNYSIRSIRPRAIVTKALNGQWQPMSTHSSCPHMLYIANVCSESCLSHHSFDGPKRRWHVQQFWKYLRLESNSPVTWHMTTDKTSFQRQCDGKTTEHRHVRWIEKNAAIGTPTRKNALDEASLPKRKSCSPAKARRKIF